MAVIYSLLYLIPGQTMQYACYRRKKINTGLEVEDQEVALYLDVTPPFEHLYLFGISCIFSMGTVL